MNRSIVITRYALALVKYVRETGGGELVCSEAQMLLKALHDVPDLRRMITAVHPWSLALSASSTRESMNMR